MSLKRELFEDWLSAYGRAWASLDPQEYGQLFADNAVYYWTPFDAPLRGHEDIAKALAKVFGQQADPDFRSQVIGVLDNSGWAHWTCHFTREGTDDPVRMDGVLKAVFKDGKCAEFREWWHRLEPGQGDLMRDFDA
jgi:hypothetical protein